LRLALGVFDGMHLGHRAVIGAAVEAARREPNIKKAPSQGEEAFEILQSTLAAAAN